MSGVALAIGEPPIARPARRRRTRDSVASLRNSSIVGVAFFLAALSWSPLLPRLLSVPFSVALLAAFLAYAALTSSAIGVNPRATLLCTSMLAVCLLLALLGGSGLLLLRLAPLPLLIFAAWQTVRFRGLPDRLCGMLTVFAAWGTAGAMLGFAYALAGGEPILTILNIDERENGLYLTTMSNTYIAGIIRPSFIYDEPGAFSFLLCTVVALREVLGRSRRASDLLMIGGLITLSLTHILITLIYLLYRAGPVKAATLVAALLFPLAVAVSQIEALEFLVSRFSIEEGRLTGDNRSNQIENFSDVVDTRMVLFGDVECHDRPERNCPEHGDISSSPVTPTYRAGIVALIVQLAVHAGLIVAYFRDRRFRFGALALSLLLLQRPYLEISGYGYISFLLLFLMLKRPPRRRLRPMPSP